MQRSKVVGLTITALLLVGACRLMGVCLNNEECARDEGQGGHGVTPASNESCTGLDIVGFWKNAAETLNFTKACAFGHSRCGIEATYSKPDTNGNFTLDITKSNTQVENCPSVQKLACTGTVHGAQLDLVCKSGADIKIRSVYTGAN